VAERRAWDEVAGRAARLARHLGFVLAGSIRGPIARRVQDSLAGRQGAAPGRTPSDQSAPPSVTLPPPLVELNDALHFARTLALSDMPPGAKTIVSAGAAGRWYFDWVDDTYGRVDRHIGVEDHVPCPDDLPEYAEWISTDVGAVGGIRQLVARSADLFLSGQNLEHLWPDQVTSFLLEANRVLRDGGWLVVDSPNGDLTSAYGWTHPEHTVEITPGEAAELLQRAGFSIESMKGLWLCREHDELLPLSPPGADDVMEVVRRFALARARPDDSFIWWAEARKSGPAEPEQLHRLAHDLLSKHWPERVSRMRVRDGCPHSWADGRRGARMPLGRAGILMFGPYMPLRAGTYDFTVEAEPIGEPGGRQVDAGRLEVVAGEDVLGTTEFPPDPPGSGGKEITCRVSLSFPRNAVHIRLFSYGTSDLSAPLSLRVEPALSGA
jgi:SAM-dependent methyltransferase